MSESKRIQRYDVVLWLVFFAFLFVRITCNVKYWIILSLISCALSAVLLVKSKMPSDKYIRLSAVLAAIAALAYLGYERDPAVLLYGLTAGVPTFLSSLAVFSVMEKRGEYQFINNRGRHPVLRSFVTAAAVGIVLSVINYFLPGEKETGVFSLWKILLAMNPGIFEEMACRAVFMSYCYWFANNENLSRFSTFTMYFMMTIPHSMAHGYDPVSTLVLAVLFGLPFALLQKKLDITSSMVSHFLVDAVRFTL